MPEQERNSEYNLIPHQSKSKEVGKKVFIVLDDILSDKDQLGLVGKWAYHYELGKNKHWKTTTKKASLISANLLFTHRQRTVNMLTDNNPTFDAIQYGDIPNEEDLDTYLKTAHHWWLDTDQQAVLDVSISNGETFGCTVEKVAFNPDLEYGMGEVETSVIPPHYFGVYPVKTKHIQKAQAVLYYYPIALREAKRKWPEKADKIESDSSYLNRLGHDELREIRSGKPSRLQDWYASISSVLRHMVGNTEGTKGKGEEDELLIVECYAKDYTQVQQNGKWQPKYRGEIRYTVTCNGGEIVLEDRSNPSINPNLEDDEARKTYLYDKFPFSRTHSITDTINAWGSSDFEQLKYLNIEINKTLSQFNLFKDKASRLKLINPRDSGVPNSAMDNYPRVIRPTNSLVAKALRYLDPPKSPIDLQAALTIYKELFFLVAGTFELELAQTPGREVVAYKAIAALLERATTMMRGKVRNYTRMITERGRMYFSCAQNFYSEDRYISFEREDVEGERTTKQISGVKLRIPAKLTVVPGSTMPVSLVQRREEAINLANKGHLDREALLRYMNWLNYRQELKRMNQGPFSNILQALAQMGTPQEIIQYLAQIFNMKPKDLTAAIKSGEIPPFNELLQGFIQQMQQEGPQIPPVEQAEIAETQAEIVRKQAQAEVYMAEAALTEEKIISERIMQYVKASGVTLDHEKLAIERARVVNELKKEMQEGTALFSRKKGQGPYRERGMASNNERIQ